MNYLQPTGRGCLCHDAEGDTNIDGGCEVCEEWHLDDDEDEEIDMAAPVRARRGASSMSHIPYSETDAGERAIYLRDSRQRVEEQVFAAHVANGVDASAAHLAAVTAGTAWVRVNTPAKRPPIKGL